MEAPSELTRRALLQRAGAGAAGLAAAGFSPGLLDALAASPAQGRLEDIEHVVFLVQENRSFDHYFGTLRGVRGFDDPSGRFAQPGYDRPGFGGNLLPFRLDAADGNGGCIPDPTHDWGPQHRSFNGGAMDSWVREHLERDGAEKGPVTMGYYTRADLPFYYALADAFTVCDGYHCSVMGPSYPNHAYSISAWIDPAGVAGGPLVGAADIGTLSWRTMPEQLSAAGVEWKVYTSADNYAPEQIGDPPFQFFRQYLTDPQLGRRAFGNSYPGTFTSDIRTGQLPAVSWVYAPILLSEHPPTPVNSGEAAASDVLQALLGNPEVWAKTALFITYDENGGFFDHVAPPTPEPGTRGEFLTAASLPEACEGIAGPIGMGYRVPMIVCSPFSRGGLVCSETFDHTSLLQFLERRFGVEIPNISAWRREHAGDLTSAFDFARAPDASAPRLPSPPPGDGALDPKCSLSVVGSGLSGGLPVPVPANERPRQEAGARGRPSGVPGPGGAGGSGGAAARFIGRSRARRRGRTVAVSFGANRAGQVRVSVFDQGGRLIGRRTVRAAADARRVVHLPVDLPSRVRGRWIVSLRLVTPGGERAVRRTGLRP